MKANKETILSALLEDLYESVTRPEYWQEFLIKVSDALSAKSALLRIENTSMSTVISSVFHGLDPALQKAYRARYIHVDPYVEAMKSLPPGTIQPGEYKISHSDLMKTEYFSDYMRPQDNHHVIGGCICRDEHFSIQFALQRDQLTGAFCQDDVNFLHLLRPHIHRAVNLQKVMGQQGHRLEMSESALERMAVGLLLLNNQGIVEYTNPFAERFLHAQKGIRLFRNKLVAIGNRENLLLQDIIRQAQLDDNSNHYAVGQMLLSENGQGEYNLFAIAYPIRRGQDTFQNIFPQASVALYIGPVEKRTELSQSLLKSFYGLTAAESRLAIELAKGKELKEIADTSHVSLHTVRTQLKSVFSKTRTNRQQDLMRLLTNERWNLAAN